MDTGTLQKLYGIGLTGGIACGKSTVAKVLQELGYLVIDADDLAREAVANGSKGLSRLVDEFGESILLPNGTLNRSLMRRIIFEDKRRRELVESIIHPIIDKLLIDRLTYENLTKSPRIWFFQAPLLFETGNHIKYRAVWTITCPYSIQLQRLQQRDGHTPEEARAIINSQLDVAIKIKMADMVIDTNISMQKLRQKIIAVCSEL